MMKRTVTVGNVLLGGDQPVRIQSMTNTDTADVEATAAQINVLAAAGCEIIRVAAYDVHSAQSIAKIKQTWRNNSAFL